MNTDQMDERRGPVPVVAEQAAAEYLQVSIPMVSWLVARGILTATDAGLITEQSVSELLAEWRRRKVLLRELGAFSRTFSRA